MDFVIYELKLRNKYLQDVKNNKIKIKKLANNFSKYSIIPTDVIHQIIKNYDCNYNNIHIIKKNYKIQKKILKMSIPLIKKQIITYHDEDINNELLSEDIFFKILERILKIVKYKIIYNEKDYLNRHTLMISKR
jgi:hypothetical protein